MEIQDLIDSKQFADILGVNVQKLNYQVTMGNIPTADVVIGRSRLWSKKTVKGYLASLEDDLQRSIRKVSDRNE